MGSSGPMLASLKNPKSIALNTQLDIDRISLWHLKIWRMDNNIRNSKIIKWLYLVTVSLVLAHLENAVVHVTCQVKMLQIISVVGNLVRSHLLRLRIILFWHFPKFKKYSWISSTNTEINLKLTIFWKLLTGKEPVWWLSPWVTHRVLLRGPC